MRLIDASALFANSIVLHPAKYYVTKKERKMTWSHRALCSICVFCSEFPDFDMWTATQTSNLPWHQIPVLNVWSADRQSSENPPFSSGAKRSCEVWRNKSTCALESCAPAACSTLPSVVPVRTELHTVRRRGAEERRGEARRRGEEKRGREFNDQSAPGKGQKQCKRVQISPCCSYWREENHQGTCAVSLHSPSYILYLCK